MTLKDIARLVIMVTMPIPYVIICKLKDNQG